MGTIRPELRFAIGDFLKSLSTWKAGEIEPDSVYQERRGCANTILALIGQEQPDDVEMMALESLARAALAACDNPQDAEAIRVFEAAGTTFLEISPPGRG